MNIEIVISEALGDITIREYEDIVDQTIHHCRLVSTIDASLAEFFLAKKVTVPPNIPTYQKLNVDFFAKKKKDSAIVCEDYYSIVQYEVFLLKLLLPDVNKLLLGVEVF
jgi:hypothetical protein